MGRPGGGRDGGGRDGDVAVPALAGPLAAVNPSNPGRAKPTIVLEHGAWADGSSWSGVVDRLQHRGYSVVAPPNPLRGLAEDAGYLASFLSTIKGPVIVVGHSYGGAVVTNAATGNTRGEGTRLRRRVHP